jgi:hypothetical protein
MIEAAARMRLDGLAIAERYGNETERSEWCGSLSTRMA